jgi:hypothetical protein
MARHKPTILNNKREIQLKSRSYRHQTEIGVLNSVEVKHRINSGSQNGSIRSTGLKMKYENLIANRNKDTFAGIKLVNGRQKSFNQTAAVY